MNTNIIFAIRKINTIIKLTFQNTTMSLIKTKLIILIFILCITLTLKIPSNTHRSFLFWTIKPTILS